MYTFYTYGVCIKFVTLLVIPLKNLSINYQIFFKNVIFLIFSFYYIMCNIQFSTILDLHINF